MTVNRWLLLGVIFAARSSMGYQFQSVGSVGPILVEHLAIDFAMLGTLIGIYKLPGVVMAFPSGLLGQRFGLQRMTALGLALMAIGGFFTAGADTVNGAMWGRLFSGTGAVVFNVLSATLVADWFARRELTLAMAIHVNSWPFGIALGLATQGLLTEAISLRAMLLVSAAFCAVGWVLVALLPRPECAETAGSRPGAPNDSTLGARTSVLVSLSAMVWLLFNAGLILVVGFAPAYLAAQGLSASEAGWLTSIGTWLGIVTIPLGGYLVQRFGYADAMMAAFLAGGALVCVLIPAWDAWLVSFALFGLIAWTPAGAIVALPVQVLRQDNRARGMGLFFSYYYLGIGLFAPAAGWLRDLSASPGAPLLFAGSLFVAALVALGVLRIVQARWPRAERAVG